MNKLFPGAAAVAALSLSGCVSSPPSKLEPRPGYSLLFSATEMTTDPVECSEIDRELVNAVPGCGDFGMIVDQDVYDTGKADTPEIYQSETQVSCGWLLEETATVERVPECYVWVKRPEAGDGEPDDAPAAPAPSSGQSAANSSGGSDVSASSSSGPDGTSSSSSSDTGGVSTSASSSTAADGTGGFSVDNGRSTMSGSFGADGSVSSVSFGGGGSE